MDPANQLSSELESFRQQWLSDLRARRPNSRSTEHVEAATSGSQVQTAALDRPHRPSHAKKPSQNLEEDDYIRARSFDDPPDPDAVSSAQSRIPGSIGRELISALDHYEEAVEKEAQGNLGDSLKLYRKAFRMDSIVDQQYRKKHFPVPAPKPTQTTTAHQLGQSQDAQLQPVGDLIASFSQMSIVPAPPVIEGTPALPCPMATLPAEILINILQEVAILDVGDFGRIAQVCKRFAYLVATEERIWRRICLGEEFGFAAMHYQWQRDVAWGPLPPQEAGDGLWLSKEEKAAQKRQEVLLTATSLLPILYSSSWRRMFKSRPRIRFNGCYISTVNYIRAGQAGGNQITWNSPVHIVTYYRYLRFFRDGTAISLLTTSEPLEVVHYLTKELMELHQDGGAAYLPSVVMRHALRGRWKLTSVEDKPDTPLAEIEGELCVETEGVGQRYIFRMDLSLGSAGKSTRNNKLNWRCMYSYNKLLDDWREFPSKNDKPFFFSRVKSYGNGE